MGNFNDAIVADLQCRFSEGEVVTWEEFYKWIGDIEDGFDSHAHDGTSGGGPVINVDDLTGMAALKARVTALEGAGYATQGYVDTAVTDMATQAWVGEQAFATEAWVASEGFATEAWVNSHFYTLAEVEDMLDVLWTDINANTSATGTNAGAITALAGRVTTIEGAYATQTWVNANFYTLAELEDMLDVLWTDINANTSDIGFNESDISSLDGRVGTAEWSISDNEGDISGLDGRVGDIEADYTTAGEAEGEAIGIVEEHQENCGNWDG